MPPVTDIIWKDPPPVTSRQSDPRYTVLEKNPGRWCLWDEHTMHPPSKKGFEISRRKCPEHRDCFSVYVRARNG